MDELEHGEPSPEATNEGSAGNEGLDTDAQIMGRLPRTRPQRRSGRRPANAAEPGSAETKRDPTTRRGQRSSSGPDARAAASSGARGRSTSRQAARRPAGQTATRTATRKRGAPGVPQLALGAAVGAAKLPLKLTATVTRQATRLIGRGLRLR